MIEQVIGLPRRGGKTLELVQAMKGHDDAVLIVGYAAEADRVRRVYGLERHQVIVASEARRTLRGRSPAVFVDNADKLLEHFIGAPVTAVSMTMDPSAIEADRLPVS